MCEAEYIVASEAANEGVWMKESISDLGVIPSASGPMKSFVTILEQLPWRRNPDFTKKTHQETLQLHPRFGQGGRHRDLKNTYGSDSGRPVD